MTNCHHHQYQKKERKAKQGVASQANQHYVQILANNKNNNILKSIN